MNNGTDGLARRLAALEALLLPVTFCDTCIAWPRQRVIYEDLEDPRESRPAVCPTCGSEAEIDIHIAYSDGPTTGEGSYQ